MCCSRLSFVLRPPWTPERPRYPIRLKVRLMDCSGRAGEGSAAPCLVGGNREGSDDGARALALASSTHALSPWLRPKTPLSFLSTS